MEAAMFWKIGAPFPKLVFIWGHQRRTHSQATIQNPSFKVYHQIISYWWMECRVWLRGHIVEPTRVLEYRLCFILNLLGGAKSFCGAEKYQVLAMQQTPFWVLMPWMGLMMICLKWLSHSHQLKKMTSNVFSDGFTRSWRPKRCLKWLGLGLIFPALNALAGPLGVLALRLGKIFIGLIPIRLPLLSCFHHFRKCGYKHKLCFMSELDPDLRRMSATIHEPTHIYSVSWLSNHPGLTWCQSISNSIMS